MAPIKWVILLSALLLTGFRNQLDTPSDLVSTYPCHITNNVFESGERITYKIYYNLGFVWIAAGEVKFEVRDKGDQYHISALGRTLKSYDWAFKVRDYYDSYIEKETLRPNRTVRKVLEGGYRLYDDVNYRHDRSIAVSKKGKTKDQLDEAEVPIVDCTHDILSSLYTMRNIDFASKPVDTRVPMNIYLDRKIYNLTVVYKGSQSKRVRGLGVTSTLLFEPELVVGNVFKDNEGMKIWVSNDQNRIPLMIESPISVGSIKAVLKSYKGLKYPTELN